MGLDPLCLVTATVLQRGLASAHIFQPFPATRLCNTPAGWEKAGRNLLSPPQENRDPGAWGMQSHLVLWRCRERGTGQLLMGPAWLAWVACGPWDAVGAEGKSHLPTLKKPLLMG